MPSARPSNIPITLSSLGTKKKKLPTTTDERYRTIILPTRSLRPPLVHVNGGIYKENINVTRTVELRAEGNVTVIPHSDDMPVVMMKNCGASTFRKFNFPHGKVMVIGVDSRCYFKDCNFNNINMTISERCDPFITRCTYVNCEIQVTDEDTKATFYRDDISGSITICNHSRSIIHGCKVHGSSGNGIIIGKDCKSYVLDCDIFGCNGSGIYIDKNGDPTVEGNRIYGNQVAGIEAGEEALGLLRKNDVKGNKKMDIMLADSATTWNEDLFA